MHIYVLKHEYCVYCTWYMPIGSVHTYTLYYSANSDVMCVCPQHRRLDAVYYYMRCLFAKSPVQSAHDNLVGLFGESSRKVRKNMYSLSIYFIYLIPFVCVCVCCVCVLKAEMQEKEKEKERRRLERETERRRKRQERRERRERKEGEMDRHVIVYPSGVKEVWVVPGSEEWRERRGRGRRGDTGEGEEEGKKNEVVEQESYSEPEEEVCRLCVIV